MWRNKKARGLKYLHVKPPLGHSSVGNLTQFGTKMNLDQIIRNFFSFARSHMYVSIPIHARFLVGGSHAMQWLAAYVLFNTRQRLNKKWCLFFYTLRLRSFFSATLLFIQYSCLRSQAYNAIYYFVRLYFIRLFSSVHFTKSAIVSNWTMDNPRKRPDTRH